MPAALARGGEYADDPAYDDTVQAASGLAFINADASGAPRYLPTILCDKVAGLHLAIAMLAAIAGRDRSGKSIAIETPMFETMAAFLLVEHLAGETFRPALGKMGYDRLTSPMRKPFATKDGYISILPYNKTHWEKFLTLIGRDDLVEDERVTDPVLRSKSLDMLYGLVADAAPQHTTEEWLSLMDRADIPCAKVNRLEDLLDDPHLNEVDFFQKVDHPTEGPLRTLRSAYSVSGVERRPDRPAPKRGNEGREILEEAGFTEAEIEAGLTSGALSLPI